MSLRDVRAVLALGRRPGGLLVASCDSPDSKNPVGRQEVS